MDATTQERIQAWILGLAEEHGNVTPASPTTEADFINEPRMMSPPPSFSPSKNCQKHHISSTSIMPSPKKRRADGPLDNLSDLTLETQSIPMFSASASITKSRSSSPTRAKINFRHTRPMIEWVPHDDPLVEIPMKVRRIHDSLCLPVAGISETSPATTDQQFAKHIRKKARDCAQNDVDENAWVRIVEEILGEAVKSPMEVISVQTQTIFPAFVPQQPIAPDTYIPVNRKTDLGIGFPINQRDRTKDYLEELSGAKNTQLNFFINGRATLFCSCVEVKSHIGNYKEAEEQLGIWVSSYGRWVQSFAVDKPIDTTPPVLCLSVVGDIWRFYLGFWRKTDFGDGKFLRTDLDELCLWGPLPELTQTTDSYKSTLRLVEQLRRMVPYLEHDFKADLLTQLGVETSVLLKLGVNA
ncbi:MAG: hypothetical protein M1834_009346 [Cirrosporium novae-zelandiae]|nr:MAG: hypothetical protein M1834_009346 [Cirrosporium novae-zelandiae]